MAGVSYTRGIEDNAVDASQLIACCKQSPVGRVLCVRDGIFTRWDDDVRSLIERKLVFGVGFRVHVRALSVTRSKATSNMPAAPEAPNRLKQESASQALVNGNSSTMLLACSPPLRTHRHSTPMSSCPSVHSICPRRTSSVRVYDDGTGARIGLFLCI